MCRDGDSGGNSNHIDHLQPTAMKKIVDYGILSGPDNTIQLCAFFNESHSDYMTIGGVYPDERTPDLLTQIACLEEMYGLPVGPEVIMSHFNREILSE
jgi:hypothetical protein